MSQIEKGTTYDNSSNRLVTPENLNNHVGNAKLLVGSITEQADLAGPVSGSDQVLIADASSGSNYPVRTTIQNIFNAGIDIVANNITATGDIIADDITADVLTVGDTTIRDTLSVQRVVDTENPENEVTTVLLGSQGGNTNVTIGNQSHVYEAEEPDTGPAVVDIAGEVRINSTGQFKLPAGTTAQRPEPLAEGFIRFNKDEYDIEGNAGFIEYSINGNWIRLSTATQEKTYFIPVSNSVTTEMNCFQQYESINIWESANVVGHKQVEITMPPVQIRFLNADNNGDMLIKVELIAKKDGDPLEYVIAHVGVEDVGIPFEWTTALWNNKPTIVVPVAFLTPSNIDLTDKKLSIRVTARNMGNGDKTYIDTFSGFLKMDVVTLTGGTAIDTPYTAASQTNSQNDTFTGGIKLSLDLKRFFYGYEP